MTRKESDALTLDQYEEIMQEIWDNHRWCRSDFEHSKYIKYVRPNWDMRDGACFSIQFDPGKKVFSAGYGETEPMYDRIMNWLNEPWEGSKQ
ncbi:hypothetical protein NYE44_01600 [Paenibacillus sp. FSL L8-0493]|uniref:hypothetical protein n=1 Tax=Paenibacillus sp. FSL L8-0493 TaxID=2975333 RepID=UPI0030FD3990